MLFYDSSIVNALRVQKLENQCSGFKKYSCGAQRAILFLFCFYQE